MFAHGFRLIHPPIGIDVALGTGRSGSSLGGKVLSSGTKRSANRAH